MDLHRTTLKKMHLKILINKIVMELKLMKVEIKISSSRVKMRTLNYHLMMKILIKNMCRKQKTLSRILAGHY